MREEIIIAGFGGQGIVFAGKLLATAGMLDGKNVTLVTSYGAETRGGEVNAKVVISDEEIDSPYIEHPDILLVMNEPSLERFTKSLKPEGKLFLNRSLIRRNPPRKDILLIEASANEIAKEIAKSIGNTGIINMLATIVMVGRYLKETDILSLGTVLTALGKDLSKGECLLDINKKALRAGYDIYK